MKQKGFTLIEILVTVIIIGVIGAIATQSLFSLLRGASKVEIIKELKQSGDYVISSMSIDIRNAKDVTLLDVSTLPCNNTNTAVLGCASGGGTPGHCLRITNIDGTYAYYGYVSAGSINRLTRGGSDYLTNSGVTVSVSTGTGFTDIFQCTNANPGVTPKVVDINFTLDQAQAVVNAAESAKQIFNTQVALRNK